MIELGAKLAVPRHVGEDQLDAEHHALVSEERERLHVERAAVIQPGRPCDVAGEDGVTFGVHAIDERAEVDGAVGDLEILEWPAEVSHA